MPSKPPAPSDIADKFMLRLRDGMRDEISKIAKQNRRSMNTQIVMWLDEAIERENWLHAAEYDGPDDANRIEDLSPAEVEAFLSLTLRNLKEIREMRKRAKKPKE